VHGDYLHWGNIRPIEQDGKIVAARMLVYADEDDSYFTFITPSAYRELAGWMKYREKALKHSEKRELFIPLCIPLDFKIK
jgi:hypothetical protein